MTRLKVGQVVSWVGATGRVYAGAVKRLANERAAQVTSRDGFVWLLPLSALTIFEVALPGARFDVS